MRHFNLVKSLTRVINNTSSPSWGKSVRGFILILSLATLGANEVWGRQTNYLIDESPNAEMMTSGSAAREKTYSISKPGAVIVFSARQNTTTGWAIGGVYLYGYTDTNCSEGKKELKDLTGLANKEAGTSSGNISIDRKYRSFKFEGHGTLKKTLLTVKLTQATYLEVDNVEGQISVNRDFGTAQINADNSTSTFVVNYSNVDNMSISITGDGASQYSVNKSSITGGKGSYGNETITITYKHDVAGEHKAVITVSDGTSSITVNVSGTTTKKNTTMSWKPNTNVMNVGDVLTEEALNYSDQTRDIVFTTSDAAIIKINDDGYPEAVSEGKATITATQAETSEFYETSASQEITVTNKQKQLIEWDDKLSFKYEGSQFTQTLTASANTNITYSLSDVTNNCVSLSGNVLTITNYGTAYVTATAAETDEYIGVSMTRKVIIRDPSAACETIIFGPSSEFDLDMGWNDWGHKTVTKEISFTGEPRSMVVEYIGEPETHIFDYYTGAFIIYEYYDGNWHELKNLGKLQTDSWKSTTLTLNRKTTKVQFKGNEGMGHFKYRNVTIYLAKYLEVSTNTLGFDAQAGISSTKTFNVNYSDVQGPVGITSSNNDILSFSPSSFDADCEQHGSQQITVTFNSTTEIENISETITISNGVEPTQTITVSGKVTKRKQDINWNDPTTYNTTDKPTLSATATSGLAISSYSSDNESIAKVVSGNQLEFYGSGTVNITAHQDGNDFYEPASLTKEFTINKVTPTIETMPTATAITYGQKLSESSLTGGQASVDGFRGTAGTHNVEGSFAWTEPDAVHTANNGVAKAYQVTWTPIGTDAALYNSATCNVEVLIHCANQTITWETETNISQYTPSSEVLNATTTGDGSIVYTIDDSSDEGVGTITDNVLTLNKGGKLVINANAAATTNFNAAPQVQKTFEVGKRGLTIAWEDKEEGSDNVITTYAAGKGDIGNYFVARDAQTNKVIDIPVTITQSSNTEVVSIQNNKLYINCAGTATITATTEATDQYGAGLGTITLTSQINTPVFTWQIPQPAPNSTYTNFFTSSNEDSDCNFTFTSSNPTLAKVEGGKLIIGGDAQTDTDVTFTVTQSGNCRWNEHTETFTIHIKKPANHVPFTMDSESKYKDFKYGGQGNVSWANNGMKIANGTLGWGDDNTAIIAFTGIPDKLSFSYFCTDIFLVASQPGWWVKESEDGVNWPEDKLWNETSDSQSEKQAPTKQLKPKTRYLMFCYSGNFSGVFKNINVTELKYFYAAPNKTATEHVESINMGIYDGVGDFPVERTIYLRHANAGSDLQITIGDTENFRLEHNISTGTDQMGDDPITIIYEPADFGTHNTTLTIHDGQNPDIEIPISAAAQPGATYIFVGNDGDAGKLENWQVGGITPSSLPNAYHTVVVQQPMVISKEMSFYYLDINNQYPNAKVTIAPTGGLTIGQSGIRDASVNNLIIQSSIEPGKEGQGYLRISPKYTGIMPHATIQMATRSTLSTGANKDATWQYIGVPVVNTGKETYDFTVDYITWLYEWSESEGWLHGWNNQPDPVQLYPFRGYAITQYGQPIYEFSGKLLNNDQTITLTKTEGGMNGDNLFANSYAAPIDVKRFTEDDFVGNVTKTFYIFNSGSWNQWDEHKGAIISNGTLNSTTPGQYIAIPALSAATLPEATYLTMIAPMQGVYVVAEEGTDTEHPAQIKLNYTKHVWNGYSKTNQMTLSQRAPQRTITSEIDPVYARELAIRDSIRQVDEAKVRALTHRFNITAYSSNSGADNVCAIECPTYAHTYENGYDAPKIFADNEGVLNIYTNEADCGLMAVSATNSVDSMYIGFQAGDDSEYSLYITSVIGDSLLLLDTETDEVFALVDSAVYNFHATPNQANDFRFRIIDYGKRMREQGHYTPTSWQDVNRTNVRIWYAKHKLYITDAKKNSFAQIYTADGALVSTTPFNYTTSINVDNLAAGVYFVHVDNTVYKFVTL